MHMGRAEACRVGAASRGRLLRGALVRHKTVTTTALVALHCMKCALPQFNATAGTPPPVRMSYEPE